ncbi:hypothetical protein BC829DRAFT_403461, partial [Chytridium lagenaria]
DHQCHSFLLFGIITFCFNSFFLSLTVVAPTFLFWVYLFVSKHLFPVVFFCLAFLFFIVYSFFFLVIGAGLR